MASPAIPEPLRVVFFGTPELAATVLRELLKTESLAGGHPHAAPRTELSAEGNAGFIRQTASQGHMLPDESGVPGTVCGSTRLTVVAAVTQPDRPKGRDLKLQASAVKMLATEHHIPVLQPVRAKDPAFLTQLKNFNPELIIVAAFGQILPPAILDLPKHGCLNVHTSLLPKYRGAAPIQWAILNGDPETGVTIMKMDPGMDTGAIVSAEKTAITAEDTGQTLHDRLAKIGAGLLLRTIPDYVSGKLEPVPQPEAGVSHAPKIKKSDGLIDWTQPAEVIWNKIRGLVPWPGAFTHFGTGSGRQVLKISRAIPSEGDGNPGEIIRSEKGELVVACGAGALRLLELQREGGKRLPTEAFLAGCPLRKGERFGRDDFHVVPKI